MKCPNNQMTNIHLMETLYWDLNSVTKLVVDNVVGRSFMDLIFPRAVEMVDRMTKQSRTCIPGSLR